MNEPRHIEIANSRHGLFDIPVWDFDLNEVLGDSRRTLVDDALNAVLDRPAENRPFAQSQAGLAAFSPAWENACALLSEIARGVAEQSYRRVAGVDPPDVALTRAWALRIDGPEAWDEAAKGLSIVHNHPGSVLSSVLFLDGPDGGSPSSGGTMFMNPLAHAADPRLIPTSMTIPWRLLHLLVFPSWVQHGPARPEAGGVPRLTVAADFG